ncbi:hypothetical protein [Rhodopirellula baltica]|uniref:hypothetical protein n=1 Tax=Rhodopirellula baltica TaxID=265606 RepID=UPI000567670B|nr:hypothetical protein [Rhodopirellula baltica]
MSKRREASETIKAEQAAFEDYLVARLAMWAGDIEEAELRLTNYPRGIDFYDNFAASSADRTLRQLRRRNGEYRTASNALDLSTEPTVSPALRSAGGHLGGVLWAETDREFELRGYLMDLSWNDMFYEKARVFSDGTALGDSPTEKKVEKTREPSGLSWNTSGNFFIQVHIGAFQTLSAQGVWIADREPKNAKEVLAPFHSILNQIDPAPEKTDWSKEGF